MMTINCSPLDDSLLLQTTDVASPAAGGADKEALDIETFAEVAERLQRANCATFEECICTCNH